MTFFLISCEHVSDEERNKMHINDIRNYAPNLQIHDFKLEDGTRCVYVSGHRQAGLSCDFK